MRTCGFNNGLVPNELTYNLGIFILLKFKHAMTRSVRLAVGPGLLYQLVK